MNPEFLKNELERAEEADLESDGQVRGLSDLIEKASKPNPDLNATDCAKLVAAALAVNDRLRARREALAKELHEAEMAVRLSRKQ